MSRQYFGTDGIRGRVGQFPITPDFMLKLGWAAGRVFANGTRGQILIGKDTRISGYMLESVLEAGLSAAGVDVRLLGPMPTPAVAYLTRTFRASAGIVISASHNPYYDNGIKFFSADGTKLPDSIEESIEAMLDQTMVTVASDRLGKATRIEDAPGRYIEFCKATAGGHLRLNGIRVVLDCAHGATYHVAPGVFSELGAEVIAVGVQPNGLNINEDCGSTSPDALVRRVRETRADLGIAFDGDGDRVIMVDDTGAVVDGDQLLYIIAAHRQRIGALSGGVVGTQMSNLGLERALGEIDVPFIRANVGDRYVLEKLHEHRWSLGGESSGHLVCLDVTTTGDGIVSALQVLGAMQEAGRSLAELARAMPRFPQVTVNLRADNPGRVHDLPAVQAAVSAAQRDLGECGRVLLRPSGTEPVVRVMVEGDDAARVERLVRALADTVRVALDSAV